MRDKAIAFILGMIIMIVAVDYFPTKGDHATVGPMSWESQVSALEGIADDSDSAQARKEALYIVTLARDGYRLGQSHAWADCFEFQRGEAKP